MNRKTMTIAALACCLVFTAVGTASAYSSTGDAWVDYYDACPDLVAADCTACHQNGFDFNAYGEALRTRIDGQGMTNTEAFLDVESVDSDGDGYSNGQEIVVDCTLPGDASDHGTVGAEDSTWDKIKAIFR